MEHELVAAAGVPLAVLRRRGPGPAVLLVHGLASNAHLWDGVAVELAASGHDVTAVDLRGHGQSEKPPASDAAYSIPTVVEDLVALIGALGGSPPVVVGQSWGGNVAVALGVRAPELLSAVMGVDGGTFALAERYPEFADCARALAPPSLAGTTRVELEARLRGWHPDWPAAAITGALACFEVRDDATVTPWLSREAHLAVLHGLWEHDASADLARLAVPTLLVPARPAGTSAGGENVAAAERAARANPLVRVAPLTGDHDLHAQHPVAVAALVAELAAVRAAG